ncbi:hypothetical protein ACN267_03530 [Micromonospora sp. WMMD734]|uniref:hypothetical protein n=1 Tax=Micromonospora sp. WMMD734 TaxID=3404129 RepID=UPI003B9575B0
MGIWFVDPQLNPGEQRLHQTIANQLLGPSRTLGGRLVVTDSRVVFEPNRLDRLTGGRTWQTDAQAIRKVTETPGGKEGVRRYGPAGARPQITVDLASGQAGVFVVKNREALTSAIASCRANNS